MAPRPPRRLGTPRRSRGAPRSRVKGGPRHGPQTPRRLGTPPRSRGAPRSRVEGGARHGPGPGAVARVDNARVVSSGRAGPDRSGEEASVKKAVSVYSVGMRAGRRRLLPGRRRAGRSEGRRALDAQRATGPTSSTICSHAPSRTAAGASWTGAVGTRHPRGDPAARPPVGGARRRGPAQQPGRRRHDPARVRRRGYGHYEVYAEPAFGEVMQATVAWYREHLPARAV
jgi:hypothetical protein